MGFEKEELWIYNATCSETKGLIFEIILFNCRSLKVLVFFMHKKRGSSCIVRFILIASSLAQYPSVSSHALLEKKSLISL